MQAQFLSSALSALLLDLLGAHVRLPSREYGSCVLYECPLTGKLVPGYHPEVKLAGFDIAWSVLSYVFQILENVVKELGLLIVIPQFLNCFPNNEIFCDFGPHIAIFVLRW